MEIIFIMKNTKVILILLFQEKYYLTIFPSNLEVQSIFIAIRFGSSAKYEAFQQIFIYFFAQQQHVKWNWIRNLRLLNLKNENLWIECLETEKSWTFLAKSIENSSPLSQEKTFKIDEFEKKKILATANFSTWKS